MAAATDLTTHNTCTREPHEDGARTDAAGGGVGEAQTLPRATADYNPTYGRFLARKRNYSRQYSHIYHRRLLSLKPPVMEALRRERRAPKGSWPLPCPSRR